MKCRHCSRRKVNRPRDLCWTCYYTPGVKEQYESEQELGYGIGNHERPLPQKPTTIPPGRAKVAILAARAAREEALYHPDDAKPEETT